MNNTLTELITKYAAKAATPILCVVTMGWSSASAPRTSPA